MSEQTIGELSAEEENLGLRQMIRERSKRMQIFGDIAGFVWFILIFLALIDNNLFPVFPLATLVMVGGFLLYDYTRSYPSDRNVARAYVRSEKTRRPYGKGT